MTDVRRYDLFGFDYELHNPPEAEAVAFYGRLFAETGGPVLDVACGGGALATALAGLGAEVVGLDLSETMLDRARRRRDALPPPARARLSFVRGDMRDFDLGREFRLVLLVDNALREIETKEEILACFRAIRRHVAPDGRFVLTEMRFDPALYPGGERIWPWSPPVENPATGERVRRRLVIRHDTAARRLRGTMLYEVAGPGAAPPRIEEVTYLAPILDPAEYLALLEQAGFAPRLGVGWTDDADDGRTPLLHFTSRPVTA